MYLTNNFLVFIVILTLTTPLCSQPVDFENGIVGYFPFNLNVEDKSYQGSNALNKGAELTIDRYGNVSSAYKFDGKSSTIRIPSGDNLQFQSNQSFSISLWIKPRDINAGCIMFKNYDYGIKWNGLKKPLPIYTGPESGFLDASFDAWSTSTWYNLVLVQKSNEITLYINGKKDQTFPYSHSLGATGEDVFIGKHPYYWGAFEGSIDDICFFSRELNPIEIEALSQIEIMPLDIQIAQNLTEITSGMITGNWQGIFSQPGNKQVDNYAYWLKLEIEGDVIRGYSRIEIANSEEFGVFRIKGNISTYSLQFVELNLLREFNPSALDWCVKYANLRYIPDMDALRGNWFADNCKNNGEIILFRTNVPFNFYKETTKRNATIDELIQTYRENQHRSSSQDTKLVNTQIQIDPISFLTGSSKLTSSSQRYLSENLIPFLKEANELKINITGHTDNTGPDQLNLQLSITRAKAVADYIVSMGISNQRVTHEGFGKAKPIASNDTEEGRSKNRRVEIEIVAE